MPVLPFQTAGFVSGGTDPRSAAMEYGNQQNAILSSLNSVAKGGGKRRRKRVMHGGTTVPNVPLNFPDHSGGTTLGISNQVGTLTGHQSQMDANSQYDQVQSVPIPAGTKMNGGRKSRKSRKSKKSRKSRKSKKSKKSRKSRKSRK